MSKKDDVQFDLTKVTAREVTEFQRAAAANDIDAVALFMTRVVVACPWGDPGSVDTFAELPFFGAFNDLLSAWATASKNALKR